MPWMLKQGMLYGSCTKGNVTMNTREKLIELLNEAEEFAIDTCMFHDTCENCIGIRYGNRCRDILKADRLIANGVTIQKHGRWEQGDFYDYGDVCSICDWDSEINNCKWSYCPNCAARMDGDGDV